MSHSRPSGDPEKNEESSNYNGKKPLICYQCGKCLAIEARAIDVMINVVGIKQEIFADNPSGDMEASIEEMKEEGPKHAISEATCASGDFYSESIDGEVLEAEVFGQPSAISRPTQSNS